MPHPNGRKPPNPLKYSPHTFSARRNAQAQKQARAEKTGAVLRFIFSKKGFVTLVFVALIIRVITFD